jgi:hypothetical protein
LLQNGGKCTVDRHSARRHSEAGSEEVEERKRAEEGGRERELE